MDPQRVTAFMLGAASMMPALFSPNQVTHMGSQNGNQGQVQQQPNDFLANFVNTNWGRPLPGGHGGSNPGQSP